MKVRLLCKLTDLRDLPLDGTDVFLLTRIESVLSLEQLLDVSPCETGATMQRLRRLEKLQAISFEIDAAGEPMGRESWTAPAGAHPDPFGSAEGTGVGTGLMDARAVRRAK